MINEEQYIEIDSKLNELNEFVLESIFSVIEDMELEDFIFFIEQEIEESKEAFHNPGQSEEDLIDINSSILDYSTILDSVEFYYKALLEVSIYTIIENNKTLLKSMDKVIAKETTPSATGYNILQVGKETINRNNKFLDKYKKLLDNYTNQKKENELNI
jgi:hypothetical protein